MPVRINTRGDSYAFFTRTYPTLFAINPTPHAGVLEVAQSQRNHSDDEGDTPAQGVVQLLVFARRLKPYNVDVPGCSRAVGRRDGCEV